MQQFLIAASLVLLARIGWAQQSAIPELRTTPDALRAEIDALRPSHVAWREIAWKSCLLDGLRESREQNKPLILWVFIDRPADDARC